MADKTPKDESFEARLKRVLECMAREGVDWRSLGYRDAEGCVHIPRIVPVDIRKGQ